MSDYKAEETTLGASELRMVRMLNTSRYVLESPSTIRIW